MLLLVYSALASDSGMQRVFDREVQCAHAVDPAPDASTCRARVRVDPPELDRASWVIGVAPPGKLFVSFHTPDVDWGGVTMARAPRAFDPVLFTTGLQPDPACGEEALHYGHVVSERGPLTQQACSQPPGPGRGEVLLEAHRKLPRNTWVPVWAYVPIDAAAAADVRNWYLTQVYISMDGSTPERPAHHPYPSVDLLRAAVPKGLPPRKPLRLPPVTEAE